VKKWPQRKARLPPLTSPISWSFLPVGKPYLQLANSPIVGICRNFIVEIITFLFNNINNQ